jgi:GTP-binding protein
MFLDEKVLSVQAGKGGDGAILFRREKYVPRGGPDGGDGGKGGDVLVVAQQNLHALGHLAHVAEVAAEPGANGARQKSTGKDGEDAIIQVPCGTELYAITDEGEEKIIELTEEGTTFRLAKGGSGGWGNWHFRSSIQQVPRRANPGLPGEELRVRFVLKLIADVGLVGLPNAGKSTLLSVLSSAKPKIANYPFTTLTPQLGVVSIGKGKDLVSRVVADLPGLIEGASDGKGLGTAFLKHIERTGKIVHCIDAQADVVEIISAYDTIRKELASWSKKLGEKDEVIVLTKSELVEPEELETRRTALVKHTKREVLTVSAVAHINLDNLLTHLI